MRAITRCSILLIAGLVAQLGFADSLYTFSSVSSTYTENRSLSLGFVFTANSTFNVGTLGWFDATGTGFQSSHTVGIYDANRDLLTSITLADGTSDPLRNGFRYHAITPITLQAGATYTLAGTTEALNAYTANDFVSGFTVNPAFTIGCDAAFYSVSSTLVDPAGDLQYSDYRAYSGPNLEGTIASTDAPEPSAILLLSMGMLVLFVVRRKLRPLANAS